MNDPDVILAHLGRLLEKLKRDAGESIRRTTLSDQDKDRLLSAISDSIKTEGLPEETPDPFVQALEELTGAELINSKVEIPQYGDTELERFSAMRASLRGLPETLTTSQLQTFISMLMGAYNSWDKVPEMAATLIAMSVDRSINPEGRHTAHMVVVNSDLPSFLSSTDTRIIPTSADGIEAEELAQFKDAINMMTGPKH